MPSNESVVATVRRGVIAERRVMLPSRNWRTTSTFWGRRRSRTIAAR